MIAKRPTKTMKFGEQDEAFVKQLAKDIGCHYCKANERTYNLNRHDSNNQGETGVFAWVHKQDQDYFWIATRRVWVEEAKARVARGKKARTTCFPTTDCTGDSVCIDPKDGYQKTVKALTLINRAP